jgi:hypothetical protein
VLFPGRTGVGGQAMYLIADSLSLYRTNITITRPCSHKYFDEHVICLIVVTVLCFTSLVYTIPSFMQFAGNLLYSQILITVRLLLTRSQHN